MAEPVVRLGDSVRVEDPVAAAPRSAPPPTADGGIRLAAIPVLVVTYGNPEDSVACLARLCAAQGEPAFEVFICENGGPEAYEALGAALVAAGGPCVETTPNETIAGPLFIRQRLLRLAGRDGAPLVHLAAASANLGYAGGINAWLAPLLAVRGWPAIWILNPDTLPAPDALAELVAYAQRWGKGMVGSRLVPAADRSLVHSRGLAWNKCRAVARSVDLRMRGDFEPDARQVDARIDAPSGASMYVTRDCIDRIGLMDERYFLYFEDLDWGLRAKTACGVGYAHRSVVVHSGGTTIGGSVVASQRSALSVYLEARNSILFVRENFPAWLPWTVALQVLRNARHALVYPAGTLRAGMGGVVAGMLGECGRPARLHDGGTKRGPGAR